MKTPQVQKQDNQFIHPWEDFSALDENKRTVISTGDGIYVRDSDGNKLIDGAAGMWCVNIGHGRKQMANAIANQAMQLSYASPWSLTNSPASKLASKLVSLAPDNMNHVFFTTGGSSAVDSALRFVFFRNNFLKKPNKKHLISRHNAYHGSTFLSASVSGKTRDKNFNDFYHEKVHFISDPNPLNRDKDQTLDQFLDQLILELDNKIQELGPENVAAFIAEPIMASGGVIVPPPGYHKRCLEVCRQYDVVYISDEVVTAFGRLGHFFSSQAVFDIDADIITIAKGLTSGYQPLGAFLLSDRLLNELKDLDEESAIFSNGFTYSGHPVCSTAALKNIEIIEKENILNHVNNIIPYFQQRLNEFRQFPIVHDIRGMGLMGCIECKVKSDNSLGEKKSLEADYDLGNRIDKHCQQLGLIVRPIINMCVFSPPLIITKDQLDIMFDILHEGFKRTINDLTDEGVLGK